ncbi:MAG: DUF2800 domain-containing protein [Ruminococcus sp.]|nr:DUF2800 domain-containing protein [Ruminococcus sp.]
MNFNKHSNLEGRHAFLGASKYHWINYSDAQIAEAYKKSLAVQKGTQLHAFAAECIRLGQKLPKSRKTLNMYVNDAVGFRMTPEQPLYFSENCFGTADAVCFRDGMLRIHDLKTGVTPAHMEQLMIYAALFCLEYGVKPGEIKTELRIYQSDDIDIFTPAADDIAPVMDKIVTFDKIIAKIKDKEEA